MNLQPAPIKNPDELFVQQRHRYQEYRRAYPLEIFELIRESLKGIATPQDTDPPLFVDLGCGTGQLTRCLSREFPRARILGLDSSAEMIETAWESIAEDSAFEGPGLQIKAPKFVQAHAEAVPCDNGTASLVTAATTFHWFEREAALTEIYRVLKPGGIFAALNIDIPHINEPFAAWWRAEQARVWTPYLHPKLERYFEMPTVVRDENHFDSIQEFRFSNPHPFTAPELAEWILTTSFGSQTGRARGERAYTRELFKAWNGILPPPPESFTVDFPVFGLIQRRR